VTDGVAVTVEGAAAGPQVRLFDARPAGLDERGLRVWARETTAAAGAAYVVRSYRYPYALVAWHSEPVGVDIERIAPCDAAFAELICTPEEKADPACSAAPDEYLTQLWCSKEALSKALGDALDYEPGRLESPMRWPDGQAGSWRATSLAVAPGHAAWLCWRSGLQG
jgi:hypothetical protein